MVKTNILIIDDNESDALLTEEAIKDTPNAPETNIAHGALQALDFLNKKEDYTNAPRPSLIFLVLQMPEMDGHEFLRVIKTDPQFCDIPVIVLTTSKNPKDIDESYKLHANCCIIKPVNPMTFKKTISVINDYWLHIATLPGNE